MNGSSSGKHIGWWGARIQDGPLPLYALRAPSDARSAYDLLKLLDGCRPRARRLSESHVLEPGSAV